MTSGYSGICTEDGASIPATRLTSTSSFDASIAGPLTDGGSGGASSTPTGTSAGQASVTTTSSSTAGAEYGSTIPAGGILAVLIGVVANL